MLVQRSVKTLLVRTAIMAATLVLLWVACIAVRERLVLEIGLFFISIGIVVFFRRRAYRSTVVFALLNPFVLLPAWSMAGAAGNVVLGRPTLVFVNYQVDEGDFRSITPEITIRWSIDPEMGALDYMHSLPWNATTRLLTGTWQHGLIDQRELVYAGSEFRDL